MTKHSPKLSSTEDLLKKIQQKAKNHRKFKKPIPNITEADEDEGTDSFEGYDYNSFNSILENNIEVVLIGNGVNSFENLYSK